MRTACGIGLLFRPLRPDSIETIGVAVADAVRDGLFRPLRPDSIETGKARTPRPLAR